jgi:hypothetical protein
LLQLAEPVGELVPEGHCTHDVAPAVKDVVLAGHARHSTAAATAEYVPGRQSRQDELPLGAKRPT